MCIPYTSLLSYLSTPSVLPDISLMYSSQELLAIQIFMFVVVCQCVGRGRL